jgi:L-ascorbate metabolism protein UlaG (beta-lactamase superfamily)
MRLKGLLLFLLAWAACGQTPFEFRPLQRQTNGETLLRLSAQSAQYYRIDTSSNAANWDGFLTLRSIGLNSHTDTATPLLPSRFYRAEQLSTNALTGDHLTTTNGDVVFHPLYHASLLMSWNGKIIYNDPDDDPNFESRYTGMPKADLILVSHSHSDHYSTTKINALRNTNGIVIAPPAIYNTMDATMRSFTIALANGASTNVLGLRVDAIPAYNANHPLGTGNGYVVTIGGKRIYFSGDTGNIPEMRALQNIDIAFLCINIPYTMTPAEAINAVNAFRPKVVYPYHYRNMSGTQTNAAYFKSQISPTTGIEVRLRAWY